MIIVTGGAGFIGHNLVKQLNQRGYSDILIVDNLRKGDKFVNLVGLDIADYCDKNDFLEAVLQNKSFSHSIDAFLHQGACSVTTEWDGQFMMRNNYSYSKYLLHYCLERKIPFLYASSASVYGNSRCFKEGRDYEKPLNVYGYSKLLFDQYVRIQMPRAESQIVGFRYFNAYGPGEQHKGQMASVVFHLRKQLLEAGEIRLFGEYGGFAAGEQRRDFIHVDDVVAVNLWFLDHPAFSGIYNVGTGKSRCFNDLARAVLQYYSRGDLKYIPFPDKLKLRYQSFTEADIDALRGVGCTLEFRSLEQGVKEYLEYLDSLEASELP